MDHLNALLSEAIEMVFKNKKLSRVISIITIIAIVTTIAVKLYSYNNTKDAINQKVKKEEQRIESIDKILNNLYDNAYATNNDSNRVLYLQQIDFLKKQREDISVQIDKIKKEPDDGITTIFAVLVALFSVYILLFFTQTFSRYTDKSIDKKNDESGRKNKHTETSTENISPEGKYVFLQWILENKIAVDKFHGTDLKQAEKLKELYDYSTKLGDSSGKYISTLKDYIKLNDYTESIIQDKYEEIDLIFEDTQKRLKEECIRLNKQAVINLFISFFIAFLLIGFIIISTMINSSLNFGITWERFVIYFIPRIVSILTIVTFFLYFIKLYKTNIIDVKYYQNELTNIEQKYLFLHAAFINNDGESIKSIISSAKNIERNTLIDKGQTTSELERLKLENEINKGYLDKFWDLLKVFQKGEK